MPSETQKPSIGRIVHYVLNAERLVPDLQLPHRAAIVTDLLTDGSICLTVFSPHEVPYPVHVRQEDPAAKQPGTWHWPERE